MKKIFLFASILLMAGCNSNTEKTPELNSKTSTNQVEPEASDTSSEIEENKLIKAAEDERYTHYNGTVVLSGKYREYDKNEGILAEILCFYPDEKSAALIPREEGDTRTVWFCFDDQVQAKNDFKINDAESFKEIGSCLEGDAEVKISNYVADHLAGETADSATLDEIKSSQPFVACAQ